MSEERYFAALPEALGGERPAGDPREDRGRRIDRMRALWDQRRFLLRWTAIGLVASLLVALLIPARYEATTQLMPPDGQPGSGMALLSALAGKAAGGLGGIGGDLVGLKNSGALFVGVLNSRTVQDRIIEQFNLKDVYRESKMEDARKSLAEHTRIGEDRKSGIISITAIDHSPQRSAEMASAYAAELNRVVADVSTSSARRERIFLEERLRTVKADLDQASKDFSQFASKNGAIDIPVQGKAMVETAATVQGQLISAESELQGLEAIYTGQNVRVRSLRARIGELRAQLQKLGGEKESAAQPGGTNTGAAESGSYPTIRKLPLLGVTYFDLYRKTKIQETVYELLTQQYELAKVEEAKEIPSVKFLDVAVVPTKKSFPPRGVITILGTAFFFAGACAWILAKRAYAGVDPQDPGKQLAEEVVATVRARVAIAATGILSALNKLRGQDAAAATSTAKAYSPEVALRDGEPEDHLAQAAGRGSV